MKKTLLSIFLASHIFSAFAQDTPHFATDPTLSPDGQTAYFSFDNDIWKVPTQGGKAERVTALQGIEINPRISPDGKYLAFSSNQYGNYDVFILPLEGGEIIQLTHHQATDRVENWSWDSKTIYFTSDRYNNFSSYSVNKDGGTAKRLFPHFFNTTNGLAETPSGEYIFTNTMESDGQSFRKRYKGENNPDLLGFHPKTQKYAQHTTYFGKDLNPTVDKNGIIYYISDENNGQYNLYSLNKGSKSALTTFPTSIRRPTVSANGEKVIFEKDYKLFVYDVASKQVKPLTFTANQNNSIVKNQDFKVEGNIEQFDVSPDGKKIVFTSRGVLFVSDIKGKFVQKIIDSPERIIEVKWLKDNNTILFNQTKNGYLNVYTVSAFGNSNLKELTKDTKNNRDITLSPDLNKAVFLSGRDEVKVLDLNTFAVHTAVKDEIWAIQNSTPSFSPNSEYLLFTAYRNFEQDIFVHHLASKKSINLTKTGVSEANPVWSPDGKYIYFSGNRTTPSYPFGTQNGSVYRLALDWFDKPFKSTKFDELFETTKKDTTKTPISISINEKGLLERIELVSNGFGNQYYPQVFSSKGKEYVFYNSNEEKGKTQLFRTVFEDFENKKTEKVSEKALSSFVLAKNETYFLIGGEIHTYSADANKLDKISISHTFQKNLDSEFKQMFFEAWAGLEENFYSEDFHGMNWSALRDQYAQYLPYVKSRKELRVLLNDMLGELNSSHLGFSSSGNEENTFLKFVTNETGIVFDTENPFKVNSVARKSATYNKSIDLQKGDILTHVNSVKVDTNKDRDYYFTSPSALEEIDLTFVRNGKSFSIKVHPQNSASFKENLYDEWILDNRNHVSEKSQNRIAYTHMKNMSVQALESFLLDMVEQEQNTDATIVDLRYNRGGNVHDKVLNFLSQKPYLNWKYRGAKATTQSNFGPAAKPIVLLINEASLSDAEMTAQGFKALNLGTIIGVETYRWIIFTSANSLVDGSSYRLPSWGCYTLDGKNLEETGVAPDIEVRNTFEDRLKGKDPQLDRAIAEILKQLK